MGWQDRDYGNPEAHQRMVRPKLPSTLTGWVMGLVVVGFVVSLMSKKVVEFGVMQQGSLFHEWQVWRVFTHAFTLVDRGDALSLLISLCLNLTMLWLFGRIAENVLSRFQWIFTVCVCAVSAALGMEVALTFFPQCFASNFIAGSMVFAYALMGVCLARSPRTPMGLIFLPFTIELRWLILFFAGFSTLLVVGKSFSGANELAHLIALGVGYGITKLGNPFAALAIKLHNYRYHRNARAMNNHHNEVDRILAKIKTEGMGKLTASEKETLKRDTARLRK